MEKLKAKYEAVVGIALTVQNTLGETRGSSCSVPRDLLNGSSLPGSSFGLSSSWLSPPLLP